MRESGHCSGRFTILKGIVKRNNVKCENNDKTKRSRNESDDSDRSQESNAEQLEKFKVLYLASKIVQIARIFYHVRLTS